MKKKKETYIFVCRQLDSQQGLYFNSVKAALKWLNALVGTFYKVKYKCVQNTYTSEDYSFNFTIESSYKGQKSYTTYRVSKERVYDFSDVE